jgi:hypothetical protein
LNLNIGPTAPKERPLAARRSFIQSKTTEGESLSPSKSDASLDTIKDEEVKEKVEETPTKEKEAAPTSTITPSSSSSKSSKLPPPKTLEEVEREVAENTAKFDSSTLTKKAEAKAAKINLNLQSKAKSNIDANSIMRLVRFIMIVLLASYTGYRTVEKTRSDALAALQMEKLQTNTNQHIAVVSRS